MQTGNETLSYTYDENGNITSISKNGAVYESYTYDAKNQLASITRGTDTWVYDYDLNGNILSVTKNDEDDPEKEYKYENSNWKDLLTEYNDWDITYDAIGNPLQYRNNINLTWVNGRKLASFTKAALPPPLPMTARATASARSAAIPVYAIFTIKHQCFLWKTLVFFFWREKKFIILCLKIVVFFSLL